MLSRTGKLSLTAVVAGLLVAGCAPEAEEETAAALEGPPAAGIPVPPPEYCAQSPHDRLCSFVPHDVNVNFLAGYSALVPGFQRPFDNFSWQSFVALNWPADAQGNPAPGPIGSAPDAPRVWMSYPTALELFGVKTPSGLQSDPSACAGVAEGEELPVMQLMSKSDHFEPTDGILESTGQPLIDRDLNFVLYDVRVNPVEADYVRSEGLNTVGGQTVFVDKGKTVSFPRGKYDDPQARTGGSVGAMEIKTAWRILGDGDGGVPHPMYRTPALVHVPASRSVTNRPFCFKTDLGLVGFHVIQRTEGPARTPQDWMWSTFAHVDDAPEAASPGDPATFQRVEDACAPPASPGGPYSFFDPACTGCTPNQPPEKKSGEALYLWADSPPYAARYATAGRYGTQVVRCWAIYPETEELNRAFQQKLAGTVWANYRLINTQWQGGTEGRPGANGNLPRYLGNTTLETYIQGTASCLQCHAFATLAVGKPGQPKPSANFSFLLGLPRLHMGQGEGEAPGGSEAAAEPGS